jgi:putative transposase
MRYSDRGSQYCSADYHALVREYGTLGSLSRKGNYWGNASTESIFNYLNNQHTYSQRHAS